MALLATALAIAMTSVLGIKVAMRHCLSEPGKRRCQPRLSHPKKTKHARDQLLAWSLCAPPQFDPKERGSRRAAGLLPGQPAFLLESR